MAILFCLLYFYSLRVEQYMPVSINHQSKTKKNETLKSTCRVDHSFMSYFKYENNKSLACQRVQYLTMQPKQTITIQQVLGNTLEMVATHLKYSYNFDKK